MINLLLLTKDVFQKMLPTLTFDPQKSSDSIDLKQVEKIVTNWRSFSISRFLGETLKTELLINEPGESKEELQPGGVWMEPFGIITDSPFDTSQKGLMLGSLVEDFVTVGNI